MRDEVKAGTPEGESELLDIIRCGLADVMIDARIAIHAYVEEVKREAREGRLRDMDVPTLHKRPKPEALVQKCGACGHGRVTHSGRAGQCVGIVAPDKLPCNCREFVAPDAELGRTTQGYRVAGEPVSDAVGAEFGRLIAERDALRDAQTRQSFMTKDWCLAAAEQEAPAPASGDPFRYSENRHIDSNPLTMQCSKLCQLIGGFPASSLQTACIEEANKLLNGLLNQHVETQQLRAATGEVVGQARIVGGKLGVDLIAERVPALLKGEIMQVDLVLRHDKEGV